MAPRWSNRGADFRDDRPEALQNAVGNAVSAPERDPFDVEPRIPQEIAQVFSSRERKDRIRPSVALKDLHARAFRSERAELRLADGRAAQDDETRGWALGTQRHVAGE